MHICEIFLQIIIKYFKRNTKFYLLKSKKKTYRDRARIDYKSTSKQRMAEII